MFSVFFLVVELVIDVAHTDVVTVEDTHDLGEDSLAVIALDDVIMESIVLEIFVRVRGLCFWGTREVGFARVVSLSETIEYCPKHTCLFYNQHHEIYYQTGYQFPHRDPSGLFFVNKESEEHASTNVR